MKNWNNFYSCEGADTSPQRSNIREIAACRSNSLTSRETGSVRIVIYSYRISLSRRQTDGDMGSAPKISYRQERFRKRRQFLKNGNTQLYRISILSITQENCLFSNFVS